MQTIKYCGVYASTSNYKKRVVTFQNYISFLYLIIPILIVDLKSLLKLNLLKPKNFVTVVPILQGILTNFTQELQDSPTLFIHIRYSILTLQIDIFKMSLSKGYFCSHSHSQTILRTKKPWKPHLQVNQSRCYIAVTRLIAYCTEIIPSHRKPHGKSSEGKKSWCDPSNWAGQSLPSAERVDLAALAGLSAWNWPPVLLPLPSHLLSLPTTKRPSHVSRTQVHSVPPALCNHMPHRADNLV